MIKYNVVAKTNPQDKSVKYYAQAASPDTVTLNDIADRIEKRSTASSADVKAVFDALVYELTQSLTEGHSVRLGDLGTFSCTLRSEGTATEDAFTADKIESIHVRWTLPTKLKNALDVKKGSVTFKKVGR